MPAAPKLPFPVIGSINGSAHAHTSFLTDGRSLHPTQREGLVPHTGWPNMGAGGVPGLGAAPPTAGPNLSTPPVFNTGILAALRL